MISESYAGKLPAYFIGRLTVDPELSKLCQGQEILP